MKSLRDDCILIENHLALWVGGDLDVELRAHVDQHLEHCERCAEKALALEASRQALIAGLRHGETSAPALWPGIEHALRAEGRFTAPLSRAAPTAIVAIADASALSAAPSNARPAWRRAGLWARVGVSAAAAVMLGFMLGRSASDAPQASRIQQPTRASGIDTATHEVGREVAMVPSAPATGIVPVSSVSTNGCLRRLAPGEARLSDDAESFSILDDRFFTRPTGNASVGSPASLQSVMRR